jgi:Tudor domain
MVMFPVFTCRWYRGKIVAVELHSSPRQVDVFFVDYGESEYVKLTDVHPLPAAFNGIPFQAVECCLVDVECVGDEWDDTFDKIVTPMGQKLLHAEVFLILFLPVIVFLLSLIFTLC